MPTPPITPAPVDEAIFTPDQKSAFESAAKLGSGVPTYDSSAPAQYGPVKPAVEPTVLSSSNITEKVIPDLTKRADSLANKGTYVGQDGNMYYSDNSLVPAPVDAEFAEGKWNSNGSSYGAAPQYVNNDDNDPDLARTNELFSAMKSSLDSTTLASVNAVQQQFDILKANQRDANTRQEKAGARLSLIGGTSRYAPLDAAGVALARTSFGLQQIAKLDADENAAVAQLRQAQQSGNFQLMEKALGVAENIRQEKQKAAADLAASISKANAETAKAKEAAVQSDQIAQVLASGVTDAAKVYDTLRKAGVVITAEEVKSGINALKPSSNDSAAYKFTNEDMGRLLASGLNAREVQAVQEAYNGGDTSILSKLSPAEKAAVQKALGGTATGGNAFKLTTGQKSQLLSGGFVAADIAAIETDVARYGIDQVTEGMSQDQAKLVKRVLAGTDSVADVGADTALSREALSMFFGIPDNDESSGGFLGIGSHTNSGALDEIMAIVDKYRAVGYKDAEIMKIIQDQSK